MPMLATVIASTTAKPSMTLPRNRKVGSLTDIDRGHARFDNPTSNPRLLPKNQQNRERELPDPVLKIRAQWIRAGKFAPNPRTESIVVMPGLVPAIDVISCCHGVRRGCQGTSYDKACQAFEVVVS